MPAVASITIVVDDKGAVSALNNVTGAVEKVGVKGNPVFQRMAKEQDRARESTNLLARTLGVEVPRSLERVIAKSSMIGPVLSKAFSVSVFAAFAGAAINLAQEQIPALVESFTHWREEAERMMKAQVELNRVIIDANANIKKLREQYQLIGLEGLPLVSEQQKIAIKHFEEADKRVKELTASQAALSKQSRETQAVYAGVPGQGGQFIEVQTAAAKLAQEQLGGVELSLAAARTNADVFKQELQNVGKELGSAFGKEKREGLKETNQALQSMIDKMEAMRSQAEASGLGPIDTINAKEKQALEELARIESLYGDLPGVHERVAKTTNVIEHGAALERIKFYEDEIAKKEAMEDQFTNERLGQQRERDERILQYDEELKNMEEQTAIAMLPPWERANAEIIADTDRRVREIRKLMDKDADFQKQGAREITLIWQQEFARRRDELAQEMESLFDDITGGNIGRRFLDRFKKMVFQMVATWIMGMRQMQSASQGSMGSGGGILGAIFGGLLGLGGLFGGGVGPGGTAPIIDPGIKSLPPGFPLSAGFSAGGGMMMMPSAGPGSFFGSAGLGGLGGLFGGTGGADSQAVLGPIKGGSGGGMAASSMKGQLSSLALMGGLMLGAKGAGMGTVGGALLSVAGGAIAGLGAGMMMGAIGGPLGMLIGGIIGGIAGLFGAGKKHKQRKALEDQLTLAAKQLQDAYDYHQTDYSSAMDQLEQLRQQYADAQRKAGGDVNQRVNRHVDDTETHIRMIEAERQWRGALAFGPAQFRHGGFVGSGLAAGPGGLAAFRASAGGPLMHFAGGGEVPAILHEGEYVFKQEAVRSIGRGNLERMNAGKGLGGNIIIQGPLIHADKIDDAWLRSGGAQKIFQALRRLVNEGGDR
jgi:gas vesicle protein